MSDKNQPQGDNFKPLNVRGLQQVDEEAFKSIQETSAPEPEAFNTLYEHPVPDSGEEAFVPLYSRESPKPEPKPKPKLKPEPKSSPPASKAAPPSGAVPPEPSPDDGFQTITPSVASPEELAENRMPDLENLRKEAWDAGFVKGERDGFEKGREAGYLEAKNVGERAADYLIQVIDAISRARYDLLQRSEGDLVELAIRIAEKVVYGQLAVSPEVVRHAVSESLNHLVDPIHVTICVSPDDYEFVELIKDDFFESIRSLKTVQVVSDPGISRGGCRVETKGGEIDSTIDERLEAVKEQVRRACQNR